MQISQPRCSNVLSNTHDVDYRLAQLGLSRGLIWSAIDRAAVAHAFAPSHGFRGNANYRAADDGIHALRTTPSDAGWHEYNFLGIPCAINRDENIAISVTTGDENTGVLTDDDPATVTIKGPSTTVAAGQLDYSSTDSQTYGIDYFVLLGFWAGDETRCELSRPKIQDNQGRISGWGERILIYRPTNDPLRPKRQTPVEPAADVPTMRRRVA